jgi:hypothetical protein
VSGAQTKRQMLPAANGAAATSMFLARGAVRSTWRLCLEGK